MAAGQTDSLPSINRSAKVVSPIRALQSHRNAQAEIPTPGHLGPRAASNGWPLQMPKDAARRALQRNLNGPSHAASMASESGNPIFYTAPVYAAGGPGATSVAVADVNGDGKLDMVVTSACSSPCSDSIVSVLLGNGDGTFRQAVSYSSGGQGAYSVAVADVNGDGKPDLVVANQCDTDCNDSEGNTDTDGNVGVLLGNGDGTFQTVVKYDSGGAYTLSLAVADVNGDGKPDLLVANNCSSVNCEPDSVAGVGVLLGNGDGTFKSVVTYYSGGLNADSIAVADVNRDGKLDLLVANACANNECTNGAVGVLLGNGDGTFQTAVSYSSDGQGASSVAVADVNDDGKPDLLIANECGSSECTGANGVSVLLGNGDGTFKAAVSYGSGGYQAASLATEDVNGDGKLDLLVANRCNNDTNCTNGTVSVLLGNGDGTFRSAQGYDSSGLLADSLAVADVNGDGKLDVLVVNTSGTTDGTVGVLLGNGDGTFQSAPTYSSGGQDAGSVAVADVNGDGKLDLLVANECGSSDCTGANGTVAVLLGNGNGTFQKAVTYGSGGIEPYSVAVADVNGDGKPDLVVANVYGTNSFGTSGAVSVLLGNGDGTFQAAVSYDWGAINTVFVAVADVNGDGKLDLLVADECGTNSSCSTGAVSVLLGNGDGTFQTAVNYGSGGQYAFSVTVADVNGDGKPDLLVTNSCGSSGDCSAGTVEVLLGNGDGMFQPTVIYGSGGQYASSVTVADVNGDGKPDLLVANDGTVGVLFGNGDGTFQTATPIVTSEGLDSGAGSLVVADFNGDGNLDIVAGAAGVLLLGNGDGTFQSPLTLGAAGTGMVAGDFNGDGKPDLADSGVTVLLNIASNFRYVTTTTLNSSLNGERFGRPVSFTAGVAPAFDAGALTGSVTFYDGTTAIGAVTLSGGTGIFTTEALTVGVHQIKATYGGNSVLLPSASPVMTQVVTQGIATVTLGSSPNPSYANQGVLFTATVGGVNGVVPTGSVKFQQGSAVLSSVVLVDGSATFNTAYDSSGNRSVTAVYLGDVNYLSKASKVFKQVVDKYPSNASVTSSLNPSEYGQAVNLVSRVTSAASSGPTGTVTFKNGPTSLGTVPLVDGSALLTKTNLPVGTLSITATYNGDALNNKSTSPTLTQVISQATTTTTLTSSPNPSAAGKDVKFTATVKSPTVTPVGAVTFTNGSTTLGMISLAGGKAILTTSALPAGTTTVKATYNGTPDFTGSSGSVIQTVNALAEKESMN